MRDRAPGRLRRVSVSRLGADAIAAGALRSRRAPGWLLCLCAGAVGLAACHPRGVPTPGGSGTLSWRGQRADYSPWIRGVGPDRFQISVAGTRPVLLSLAKLALVSAQKGARGPARSGGRLRIGRIRRHSIYHALGLRTGDVIVAVNGRGLRSVEQLTGLPARVRRTGDLRLRLLRRGEHRLLRYLFAAFAVRGF